MEDEIPLINTYMIFMEKDAKRALDAELRRMRFGTPRALLLSGAVVFGVLIWVVAIPYKTEHRLGEVTGTMAHMTFEGVRQQIGVALDGEARSAGTRAKLLHPAVGETVCLRQTYYLPLPRRGLALADMRFCDG